jgi:hypothetical protein
MSIAESGRDAQTKRVESIKKKREDIVAENERLKSKRNAARWKDERDPVEYEKQKADQRAAYEAMVLTEEGREVRTYIKVPGATKAEREENAKRRHAENERERWSKVSQNEKDRKNDKVWASRKRKANWTEEQIARGLADRAAERLHRRPDPGRYEDNPDFGAF